MMISLHTYLWRQWKEA